MSARAQHVFQEILARGFRAYPRGILNGFLFAGATAAFVWSAVPHGFLLGWFFATAGVGAYRWSIARDFMRAPDQHAHLDAWAAKAAFGYGGTGLLWGVLGAACIHYAPEAREDILLVAFLIMIFAVLNAQASAAHPPVFRAFFFCAVAPIVAVSALEPSPHYVARLILEGLMIMAGLAVGRSGNRYVAESIAMRFENMELLQDLTRQKEELDRAVAAKSHFLAAASHDLRQPMQAVVLLVESLQDRVADPDARGIVRNIRSSVASMAALLNGVLDISKFDAGTVKPERSHFAVANVLERLRGTHAQQAARSGLELRVARSSAILQTDPILLYRVLANLLSNALRYTDRGRVLVGCRRRKDGIEIQVWDSGPGIAESDLDSIFKEFHQLGNAPPDRDQGMGLGLAIVERTAALLDHRLRVKSRVGHGSMFSITVGRGDAKAIRAPERTRPDWASLEGCTVLVVENERDIRAAMTILLESWGCEVHSASSGAEARALVEGGMDAPDVILADYRLPGEENGIRVIDAVREHHPGASAILISGDIAAAVLAEAERSGFKLLHKPIRPARLRSLLASLWRERGGAKRAALEAQGALSP